MLEGNVETGVKDMEDEPEIVHSEGIHDIGSVEELERVPTIEEMQAVSKKEPEGSMASSGKSEGGVWD
jgi:hypothetical protein